ncbi:MAG TPA: alpha/beta hydrolase [Burkholderiaceae bacterium]|jgi:pimeloyl-ACP methyl ester carboxylesterase
MNFVLIHGAWLGGWCWRDVAQQLRAAGHEVHTPTLTGLGERAHLLNPSVRLSTFIDDVCAVIECEELHDVILVGHSFGAMVACGVVDRMPAAIRQMILLDGLVVQHGQAAISILPPALQAQRSHTDDPAELRMPVPAAQDFGLIEPEQVAWAERRITPHPLRAYTEPLSLRHPIGNGVPVTYIAVTQPWYEPLAEVRAWVKQQADWAWREIPTCHVPMISAPQLLVQELLEVAVRRTG